MIVGVCPTSMTIPGTSARWREWTGLPSGTSGPVVVPGALALTTRRSSASVGDRQAGPATSSQVHRSAST